MTTRFLLLCMAALALLSGCEKATINPNFSSANPEMMYIGTEAPPEKAAELLNLGSFCLQVKEQWKVDGKTPDGQTIWTKDSLRTARPCR